MQPPESDAPLSRLLRLWQVRPPVDPEFRTATWRRIEAGRRAGAMGWVGFIHQHAAVWAIVFAVTMGAAGATGNWAGRQRNDAQREAILTAYVTAIDARARAATMDGQAGH